MAQPPSPTGPAGDPDPSMDDILASIRRILNDDDKTQKPPGEDVLMLDPSMMVEESEPPHEAEAPWDRFEAAETKAEPAPMAPQPAALTSEPLATEIEPVHSELVIDEPSSPSISREVSAPLVAPEAATAAASSIGTLMRTLAAERSAAVSRGGVTIEDVVREEVRPVLKAWLDEHLPPLVERLVQAEIERVVGRNAG